MKKIVKSGMFLAIVAMMTAGGSFVSCEDDYNPNENNPSTETPTTSGTTGEPQDTVLSSVCSNYEVINPILINDNLLFQLNNVFSKNNNLVDTIQGDMLYNGILFVTRNQQEFSMICNDTSITNNIDFNNYMLVWGKITTGTTADNVVAKQLLLCLDQNTYNYCVIMCYCNGICQPALKTHYYWNMYPKNNDNIQLNIIPTWL